MAFSEPERTSEPASAESGNSGEVSREVPAGQARSRSDRRTARFREFPVHPEQCHDATSPHILKFIT